MSTPPILDAIPLASRTPDTWAASVLEEPLALLNDHAYLEKKAASNALELLNRWPEPGCPEDWVRTLAAIASDEAAHLSSVVRLLARRGGGSRGRIAIRTPAPCGACSQGGRKPGAARSALDIGHHRGPVVRAVRRARTRLRRSRTRPVLSPAGILGAGALHGVPAPRPVCRPRAGGGGALGRDARGRGRYSGGAAPGAEDSWRDMRSRWADQGGSFVGVPASAGG